MHTAYLLPALVFSLPALAFKITALHSTSHDSSAPSNASITLTVCDDLDPSKATATCTQSWYAAGPPPPGIDEPIPCDNPEFQWQIGSLEDAHPTVEGYVNAGEFGVSIVHGYHDQGIDANPAENFLTRFGNANVNSTVLIQSGNGSSDYTLKPGTSLPVAIYEETL